MLPIWTGHFVISMYLSSCLGQTDSPDDANDVNVLCWQFDEVTDSRTVPETYNPDESKAKLYDGTRSVYGHVQFDIQNSGLLIDQIKRDICILKPSTCDNGFTLLFSVVWMYENEASVISSRYFELKRYRENTINAEFWDGEKTWFITHTIQKETNFALYKVIWDTKCLSLYINGTRKNYVCNTFQTRSVISDRNRDNVVAVGRSADDSITTSASMKLMMFAIIDVPMHNGGKDKCDDELRAEALSTISPSSTQAPPNGSPRPRRYTESETTPITQVEQGPGNMEPTAEINIQSRVFMSNSKSKDQYLKGFIIRSYATRSVYECYEKCLEQIDWCKSFNFQYITTLGHHGCELNSIHGLQNTDHMQHKDGYIYYEVTTSL